MTTLPDKPSALIRLALDDLAKVEAMPEMYRVEMGEWHNPHHDDAKCRVCLAGSVIARTLGAAPGDFMEPSDYPDDVADKLCALDRFRIGRLYCGLYCIGLEAPEGLPPLATVTPHSRDPNKFRADMLALAAMLEEHGL